MAENEVVEVVKPVEMVGVVKEKPVEVMEVVKKKLRKEH